MKRVDTDNSGFIDFNEFIAATMSEENILKEENIKQCFSLFD